MISLQKLIFSLVIIQGIGILVLFFSSYGHGTLENDSQKNALAITSNQPSFRGNNSQANQIFQDGAVKPPAKRRMGLIAHPAVDSTAYIGQFDKLNGQDISMYKPLVNPLAEFPQFSNKTENPFYELGAYPSPNIRIPFSDEYEKMRYDKINFQLIHDEDYCEKVDYFNLAHPENMFKKLNFFTDFELSTLGRYVIREIGFNTMPFMLKYGPIRHRQERTYHFDTRITSFFLSTDGFYKYHEIGKNWLCATQMYNHIPGTRALVRKDTLVESVDQYAQNFKNEPQCFNKHMFFPYTYRLYQQEECTNFFAKINSPEYLASLATDPIQYMIKIGHGSHSGDGVFILSSEKRDELNLKYESGSKCGKITESLLAQTYVSNPLLLDLDNKFDFRIYMIIASTNPLMVYYHDGFLRATLSQYDKFSQERNKHLTNTHVAEGIFQQARDGKVYNMTEEELRDYHIWKFEELEEYLLESGKINDTNWLDNHLRPQFKKAMIHLVKMSSSWFWKQSNVYGFFGLDFMLDDKFNLWFIEGNPNPQLKGTSKFLGELINGMLRGLHEIQYGLYRSRMARLYKVLEEMKVAKTSGNVDLEKSKMDYQEAAKNRFEEEFNVTTSKFNKWQLVMDESLKDPEAYQGLMAPECMAILRKM